MKKMLIALAIAGFSAAPVMAQDLEAGCEAYAAENGTDASGCACLAETADADVAEELMMVAGPEDFDGLSDDAKAAIGACFPAA